MNQSANNLFLNILQGESISYDPEKIFLVQEKNSHTSFWPTMHYDQFLEFLSQNTSLKLRFCNGSFASISKIFKLSNQFFL